MNTLVNNMNNKLIQTKDLTVGYKNKTVLQEISISLSYGEVLCVLGPNGSGKSTLFKSILGLLPVQSGHIYIDDKPIKQYSSPQLAQTLAYVPQAIYDLFDFEVIQVVLMGRLARLKPFSNPSHADYEIAKQCLDQLNIGHLKRRLYTQLSGGQRQLVLIARALAQQPKALVMDEPTSSLDFGNQIRVLQTIQNLKQQGLSILFCTHNPQHAISIADKVVLFKDGGIYKSGITTEIINQANLAHLYSLMPQQIKQHLENMIR